MSREQNIKVFVRCRPLNSHERCSTVEVSPTKSEIKVVEKGTKSAQDPKNFNYDQVFGPDSTQNDVYKSVVFPLIEQVLQGFNCTVFAYGQTGTGKTYTMEGHRSEGEYDWETDPHSGMIPRAISQLFDTLEQKGGEFPIRVSFLELYNEDTYDLLSMTSDTTKLKMFNDTQKSGSVKVDRLEEILVSSKDQIYEILQRGSAKRQKAATLLNASSSRSHTVFSILVHSRELLMDGEESIKSGKLNLVDLAGSENIRRSGAQDKRAREAGSINQSLLTLGRVIMALGEKRSHIPYRESKLTRLLQDSLGGRTKTSIIATISPSATDFEDTLSTLEYAFRARKILNKPEMNQRMTSKQYRQFCNEEIARLKAELETQHMTNGVVVMTLDDYKEYRSLKTAAIKVREEVLEKHMKLQEENEKLKEQFEIQGKEISAQKKKEKQLVSYTRKSLQVASDENNLLHGKIERVKSVIQDNRSSIDRYFAEISDNNQRCESLVEIYSKDLIAMTKDARVTAAQALIENESDNLDEFIESFKKRSTFLRELIGRINIEFESVTEEITKRTERLEKLKKQAASLSYGQPAQDLDVWTKPKFKTLEDDLELIAKTTMTMESTMKREINYSKQKSDSFYTHELRDDIQTGSTPQKKTYDLPKKFVQTSFCEDITEEVENGHQFETSGIVSLESQLGLK